MTETSHFTSRRSKIIVGACACFLLICVAFAIWSRMSSVKPPTTNTTEQPAQPDPAMPTCDGFKILQGSGWFCIPKMGKPYKISGPDKKITGEKSIPKPPAH